MLPLLTIIADIIGMIGGFFIASTKGAGITASDPRLFTRAGSFQLDDSGYLRNDAGLYLQGWVADSTGEIATDPSDLSRLRPINVASVGGSAQAQWLNPSRLFGGTPVKEQPRQPLAADF